MHERKGWIGWYLTTPKHHKAWVVCVIVGKHCITCHIYNVSGVTSIVTWRSVLKTGIVTSQCLMSMEAERVNHFLRSLRFGCSKTSLPQLNMFTRNLRTSLKCMFIHCKVDGSSSNLAKMVPVSHAQLRYKPDYLVPGICNVNNPAAMAKVIIVAAKIHTVMLWLATTLLSTLQLSTYDYGSAPPFHRLGWHEFQRLMKSKKSMKWKCNSHNMASKTGIVVALHVCVYM